MQLLNNKNKLFDLLGQGTLIITPNNRLSGAILDQYFQNSKNKTVDKPNCLPYSTMVIQAYQELMFKTPEHPHPTLLNTAQCQFLWREIINTNAHITFSEGLLNNVMQAWENCQLWQINPENTTFQYTPQTRQFQQWWLLFNKRLKEINAISEHQLIPYLLASNEPIFTKPMVWVCFDDFTPQQLSLQNLLIEFGLEQYTYDLKESEGNSTVLAATDIDEEYQQLIAWLHLKLEEGEKRIGVVVPNLQQESRFLKRVLHHQFDSGMYNISLGQSLSEFPLVEHALAWLNINDMQCNPHQAALFLQSPYIGSAKEEFNGRSQFLQDSTLLQDQSFPIKTFITDLKSYAPKLAELLNSIKPYPKQASPQKWVQIFLDRLNLIGFPGDYGLNSENYQCLNRFTAIFDELMQFHLITPSFTTTEVLNVLNNLTIGAIFQAQKLNAPIQISGLLEASGCEFDSLWVMGLTDQCLPQKTRLSAFIPAQLQRDLLMPHCLPERELQFAQQTLDRLQKGSLATVFSYSRLQGDNPNLPCSLINGLPQFEPFHIDSESIQPSFLIEMEETYQLPIKSDEQFSGGTALLANQAKCPFKAFADHRLRAKPSVLTADGLDNRERGTLIHKVMELLWHTLGSQKELLALNHNELDQRLDKAIQTALDPLSQLHPDSFPNLIKEVEFTRLKRIILSCLDWEKQRPPFEVVVLEQSYSIKLADIDFKVRVDRLDRVDDKKWVIDYKSSLPTSKPWNEERPKEPQLLLYALLDEQINTLLLLQLKSGKTLCNGVSEEQHNISGINSLKKDETWGDCRETWKQQLTDLADEFQRGHIPPQPSHPSICQQCDFQNLCRFQVN